MPPSGVLALTQPLGAGLGIQEPLVFQGTAVNGPANLTIDGKGLRRLVSLVFTVTTDANVANRYVTVEYLGSDGNPYCVNAAAVVVTANSTQRFAGSSHRTIAEWAANADVLFPLEPLFLNPSDVVRVNIASAQAGDSLSRVRGVIERFPLDWHDLPARNA